jgi:hypothetical protein
MISPCILPHHDSNASKPSKVFSVLFVFLLLLIHTTDMILTRNIIGDDWWRETFLPMSYCIKWLGIYNALWVSRICIYSLLFVYFLNMNKWAWYYFLVTGTILYWTAMIPWLWTLGYINWP